MQIIKKIWFAVFVISCFGSLLGQNPQQPDVLSEQQKSIISIAALTAKGDLGGLKEELNKGLDAGLTIQKIKECIVHTYAYCGFPRSIRGLQSFMEVLEERKSKGIQDEIGPDASPISQDGSKYERGKKILSELTKATPDRPLTGYVVFAPVIDTFLKEHLFADIFERDVLSYAERELVTISVLSAIGNAAPMLRSHFNICLNVGLSPGQLNEFVEVIRSTLSAKEAESASDVLSEVLGTNKITMMPDEASLSAAFPKGEKVASPHFTGTVWLHMLVTTDTTFNINAGNVTFESGARTNWHSHPGGQILLVTSGKGRYQEQGKPVIEIRKGDVIKCEPNVKHWHGAAPDSELSHIAIGTNQDKGAVKWLEPVTDKEYRQ
jgi:4-carboxymuconolactone decarboxylase